MISHGERRPAAAKAKTKAKPSKSRKKPAAAAAGVPETPKTVNIDPIVVDGGTQSRSCLRDLEQGTGPLMHEIGRIVQAIHDAVPEPASIVIKYREKPSSGSRSASPFALFF